MAQFPWQLPGCDCLIALGLQNVAELLLGVGDYRTDKPDDYNPRHDTEGDVPDGYVLVDIKNVFKVLDLRGEVAREQRQWQAAEIPAAEELQNTDF